MKLVASMIVAQIERDRYLLDSVGALLEFCDEVVVLFDLDGDWSTAHYQDGGLMDAWGFAGTRVIGCGPWEGQKPVDFFAHEGRARQALLDATIARNPTHVLAIDADEFVADPQAVRAACNQEWAGVRSLVMREVWDLDGDCICVREDGGWRSHPVDILWAVPASAGRLTLADRALACGRVPTQIAPARMPPVTPILHLGWANKAERAARHQRYVQHDGGAFHASSHLDSIMWTDDQVTLDGIDWPVALEPRRASLTSRVLLDTDRSTV